MADAGRGHQLVERLRQQLAQRAIEKGDRKAPVGRQNPIGKGLVEAAVVGSFNKRLTKPFVSAYESIAVVGDGFPGHWYSCSMVNWFTFLENQPDVDHEKHQPGRSQPSCVAALWAASHVPLFGRRKKFLPASQSVPAALPTSKGGGTIKAIFRRLAGLRQASQHC